MKKSKYYSILLLPAIAFLLSSEAVAQEIAPRAGSTVNIVLQPDSRFPKSPVLCYRFPPGKAEGEEFLAKAVPPKMNADTQTKNADWFSGWDAFSTEGSDSSSGQALADSTSNAIVQQQSGAEKIFFGTDEFDPSSEEQFLSDTPEARQFLSAIDGRTGPKTIALMDLYLMPPAYRQKVYFCQSSDKAKPLLSTAFTSDSQVADGHPGSNIRK